MSKREQITLAIPKPCTEDWAKMTPNERGRHCASCDKIITDFTTFTDKELINFISNTKGKLCGKISPQQLNRPLVDYGNNKPVFWQHIFWSGALVSLAACHGSNPYKQSIQTLSNLVVVSNDTNNKRQSTSSSVDSNYISGQITGMEHEGLTGLKIGLQGTYYYTQTDYRGSFKLTVPDNIIGTNVTFDIEAPNNNEYQIESCYIDKLPFSKDFIINEHKLPLLGIINFEPIHKAVSKDGVYTIVDTMPKFNGDLEKYLNDHIVYPKKTIDFQGTVYVSFIAEISGKIDSVHLLRGIHPELDSIALNAIKDMPNWIPGKLKGRKVKVRLNLPIHFI